MSKQSTFLVVVAFALGCAAARTFVVPPAHAQGTQRWEYFCFDEYTADKVIAMANAAGTQGWEMSGASDYGASTTWCFKRAK